MLRRLFVRCFLLLLLGCLSFAIWITRNPDSPSLDRVAALPMVGALSEGLRALYRHPPAAVAESVGERPAAEAEVPPPPAPRGARPRIWVTAGTLLRSAPRPDAPVEIETGALANLALASDRGEWLEVEYRGVRGWMRRSESAEPAGPPLGSEPLPPGPLPPREPDVERLALAREILGARRTEERLGGYKVLTDTGRGDLLQLLGRVAEGLAGTYERRYGLRPVGEPREAVVLFEHEEDYRAFLAVEDGLTTLGPSGHVGYGIVATYVGERSAGTLAGTLAHELTHLVNRRSLGPALPAWLDEGLADDLGQSRLDENGRLLPGTLAGEAVTDGDRQEWSGALASAVICGRALAEGRFPRLLPLLTADWRVFVAPERSELTYAASFFWVRYLLDSGEEELATGFRSYLKGIAAGESAGPAALLRRLGRPPAELEEGWRAWLSGRALAVMADGGSGEAPSAP